MKKLDLFFIDANYSVFINSRINIIITLYVNNVLIIKFNYIDIQRIKKALNIKFYIIDLRSYIYYLKIIIIRNYINRIIRLK